MKRPIIDENKPIKHPFKVEKGYFESLESRIIDSKSTSQGVREPVFNLRWVYASASFAVIIVLSVVIRNSYFVTQPEDYLAEVTNEEIITYLAAYELSSDELIEGFGAEYLQQGEESDIEEELDQVDIDEDILDEFINKIDLDNQFEI